MPDIIRTGVGWMAGQLMEHASRTVVYRRGSSEVRLSACVGHTLLKMGQDGNIWMQWTDRDYLILAADLILGGQAIEPERGDQIEDETDNRIYVVLAPSGEAPWRYDAQRKMIQIHTKDMGAL